MLACITGGYNIKERLRCINELKGFGAAGYVIEGFHTNGESATNLLWEEVEPVLTETLVRYQSSFSWQTVESRETHSDCINILGGFLITGFTSGKSTSSIPWTHYTYRATETRI